jgi:hypothetical protein
MASKKPFNFVSTTSAVDNVALLKKIAAAPSIIGNYKKNIDDSRNIKEIKSGDNRNSKNDGDAKNNKSGGDDNRNNKSGGDDRNNKSGGDDNRNNKSGGDDRNNKSGGDDRNNKSGGDDARSHKSDTRSHKSDTRSHKSNDVKGAKDKLKALVGPQKLTEQSLKKLDTQIKSQGDVDTRSRHSNVDAKSRHSNVDAKSRHSNVDTKSRHSNDDTKSRHSNKPVSDLKNNKYSLQDRPAEGTYIPSAEKIYTPEQIEKFIFGYFVVPKNKWNSLPVLCRIRFEDTHGKFNEGGIVKSVNPETIAIKYGYASNGFKLIPFNTIKTIYKQYAYTASIEVDMLINSVKELTEHIKQLKARVTTLEEKLGHN